MSFEVGSGEGRRGYYVVFSKVMQKIYFERILEEYDDTIRDSVLF